MLLFISLFRRLVASNNLSFFIYKYRCEELYYGDLFIAKDEAVDKFVQQTRNPNLKVSISMVG